MINANDRILFLKQGAVFVPIACLTSNSFSESSEEFSITTRLDGGWTKSIPDSQSYEISFDGVSKLSGLSYFDLQTLKRQQILIKWGIGTATDIVEQGDGYIVALQSSDDTNQNSVFSGTIRGYGQPETIVSAIGVNPDDFLSDGNDNLISD